MNDFASSQFHISSQQVLAYLDGIIGEQEGIRCSDDLPCLACKVPEKNT